jgi:hypothetical protein
MQIWIHACQQRRDVQDIIQARDPRGKTVGHAAYDGQSVPGACLWFAAGGDPNCLDDHGLTMMDVVYRNFNTASPEIYVRHINPFCQDAWTTWIIAGGTVLGGAIGNGSYTTFANTIAQSVSSSHPRIAVSRQALRMLAGKQRLTPSFRSAVQTPEGRACALELVPHWRDPLLLASWVSAIPDM